jgi:hypothetical protein
VSTRKSHACEDCGERATRQTAEGIWLCEGDYRLLLEFLSDDEVLAPSSSSEKLG